MNAMLDRARRKRGIVLLVVISLLTLFILLGVTYTLVATQYRDAALNEARRELYGDNPETEMELVLGQLLYGSLVRSTLQHHDLLGDLYGSDHVTGTVTGATAASGSGGQIISVTYSGLAFQDGMSAERDVSDYFTGRVITFTNGSAKGMSSRVMGYEPTTDTLLVEAVEGSLMPSNNDKFIINGAPFNGAGFGFDATAKRMSQLDAGRLVSLMPHFAGYAAAPSPNAGGPDESYDAADAQNMHLAWVPADRSRAVVPSFHRPDLVNYWNNQVTSTDPGYVDLMRQVVFRPLKADHPNFTGSNPTFDPVTGPWDVDNDGDGIADSIWIDPGLPVVTAPNGRRYKRLVALLIKDLDGRINANAAGNTFQAEPVPVAVPNHPGFRADVPLSVALGVVPSGQQLPRGIGVGPAEIDFRHLFGSDNTTYKSFLQERYGSDGVPGAAGNDSLSIVRFHGLFDAYPPAAPGSHGWYGSPPDTWGRWAVAKSQSGQPIWSMTSTSYGEGSDDPYEMEFDASMAANDEPFTVAELERLLRYYDPDAPALPDRLEKAAGTYLNGDRNAAPDATMHAARQSLTTISSHLPVVETAFPAHLRASVNAGQATVLDLYQMKLATMLAGIADPAVKKREFNKIVPWEFRHGQRLDINRYLGDGVDLSPTNGAADDPAEAASGSEVAWTDATTVHNGSLPPTYSGITANHSNDVDADADGTEGQAGDRWMARQLLARHLYCLMLMLTDDTFLSNPPDSFPEVPTALTQPERETLLRRRIAQWAINVVDFRDSDAIMTRFDYDVNPWDGWNPDGSTFVWGCETPDLLLGETIAFHDRRVKDTDIDTSGEDRSQGDPHLDQLRMPQGSLFIELYNARNKFANSGKLPNELYDSNTKALQLGRMSGNVPVWRLAITRLMGDPSDADRDRTPDAMTSNNPETASYEPSPVRLVGTPQTLPIERFVWFTDGGGAADAQGNVFYNTGNPQLAPGQYAVVGPREETYLGSLKSSAASPGAIGLWGGNSLQKISLAGGTVTVTDATGAATNLTAPQVGPVLPIVASMTTPMPDPGSTYPGPIGLSISEPLKASYYPAPPDHANPPDAYDSLDAPTNTLPDEPFDTRNGFPLDREQMLPTATYGNAATVFLQRLADPTRAFDATNNPYITVDWAAIDLTVFTGEEDTARQTPPPGTGDLDPDDPEVRAKETRFATRERGYEQGGAPAGNIWPPQTQFPGASSAAPSASTDHYFRHELTTTAPDVEHTLGYLNSTVGTPMAAAGNVSAGDPSIPFPWLAFNNRPYSNPMELLLVPSASPSRLLSEVTPGPLVPGNNIYDPIATAPANFRGPFGHLLNFFHSSRIADGGNTDGANFYRLLDYVEVPSPFTHVDRYYNPGVFANSTSFKPPFNRLSRFRDPGRININTVTDERVLRAAIKGMGLSTAEEDQLILDIMETRNGRTGAWWDHTASTGSVAATIANPFRSADAADLMPYSAGVPAIDMRYQFPAQATLLRSVAKGVSVTPTQPLFAQPATAPAYPEDKPNENAYLKFQKLQKVGNLFSNHSNAYAVWMTVGYFEVETAPSNAGPPVSTVDIGNPDGLALGMELGADTGEIRRHRSFYIIDRSIPVAYEPGQRHNADRTVLLRRFIE